MTAPQPRIVLSLTTPDVVAARSERPAEPSAPASNTPAKSVAKIH